MNDLEGDEAWKHQVREALLRLREVAEPRVVQAMATLDDDYRRLCEGLT
jgi:hypothetical protein